MALTKRWQHFVDADQPSIDTILHSELIKSVGSLYRGAHQAAIGTGERRMSWRHESGEPILSHPHSDLMLYGGGRRKLNFSSEPVCAHQARLSDVKQPHERAEPSLFCDKGSA